MYRPLNGRKDALLRANSICPTPQEVLLELVLKNDHDNIARLLEAGPELLKHIYTPEYNKPILLIACSEDTVEAETVKTLIEFGADVHYSSEIDEEWEAIHFAACGTNSETLKVIIDSFKNPAEINAVAKGNNALHILIKHGNKEAKEEFVECARLLVKEGIDVNLGDSNYVSPILWAAKKGYKEIVKVILENSVLPVDLDSHRSRNKTARDIIVAEQLYSGGLPEKFENSNDTDETILFRYLLTSNENAFITFKNGDIFDLVNAHDTSTTLLQLCCIKGLAKAAGHLIDKGAEPNLTSQKNSQLPIEIVAESGFYEVFEKLLEHPKIQIPRRIPITLLKYYENEKFSGIDHSKCYNYLLKKLEKNRNLFDINEQDESKNSPLHYAIRYTDADKIEELLDLGASLGSKNKYGLMPVQDMEPELLEKHLDKCIQFDLKSRKTDKEDFTVTFNYHTLIPPARKIEEHIKKTDAESNFNTVAKQELVTETEVIYYLSKAPEFKHLLQHPVIVSFLFIKWYRIRWLFYTNLAFYIAFFVSLVVYIFASYADLSKENSESDSAGIVFCKIVLLVTYFALVFREIFQMCVSPRKYFKSFENYVEIILIFITGAILFISSPADHTRKQLSSLSILLAAFELVLMFGQHPKLSTNVVMLKTVSFNFFKFLGWYSLLIVAFAFSFYILFNGRRSSGGEEDDDFDDFGKSFFKTIIMTTGEFDAGSINFGAFPITSKIIFSLFIFMIVIILLNLLNGLAVSDTQMIKNNAELVGHIARAEHIHYVESMLLGNILPSNIMSRLKDLCCCFPSNPDFQYTVLKPLAKKACIFPHFLNYEMTVYPNKCGQIELPLKKSKYCLGCCSNIYLDKTTLRRINSVVHERREALKAGQEVGYVQKLENIMENMERSMKIERLEIFMLNKKLDDLLRRLAVQKTE